MATPAPFPLDQVDPGVRLVVRAATGDRRSYYEVTVTRLTPSQVVTDREVRGVTFEERYRRADGRLIAGRPAARYIDPVAFERQVAVVDWTDPVVQAELFELARAPRD